MVTTPLIVTAILFGLIIVTGTVLVAINDLLSHLSKRHDAQPGLALPLPKVVPRGPYRPAEPSGPKVVLEASYRKAA